MNPPVAALFSVPGFIKLTVVYDLLTLWVPPFLLLLAVFCFLARRPRRWPVLLLTMGLLLGIARLYCTHWEPFQLGVRHVTIVSDKVDRPLKLLHISDLQPLRVGPYEDHAFEMMRETKPDLVIFTGDLIQCYRYDEISGELGKMSELLATLHPSAGLFGVYGDTDWRILTASTDKLGGMRMLPDQAVTVQAAGTTIRILGLTRDHSRNGDITAMVSNWLDTAATGDLTILAGHAPDYITTVSNMPIDLCLAGHTHGGQIRIPFLGPIVTLSRAPRRLALGFHEVGRTRLDVSGGIGCEHADALPSIRFNCPPEMTLVCIEPRAGGAGFNANNYSGGGFLPLTVLSAWVQLGWSIVLPAAVFLCWAYGCLWLAGYLKMRRGWRTGYTRKVFHFLIFTTAAAVQYRWGLPILCLFGCMTSCVILYALLRGARYPMYEAMAREKDEPHRTYYIIAPYAATLIGGLAGNMLFGKVALAGYLVAGLGDAIGEPVGTRFGRHRYRVPAFWGVPAERSIEGSVAVFVASCVALFLAAQLLPSANVQGAFIICLPVIALVSALVEAVSPHGWDNATLQLVPAWLFTIYLNGG